LPKQKVFGDGLLVPSKSDLREATLPRHDIRRLGIFGFFRLLLCADFRCLSRHINVQGFLLKEN